MAVGTEVVAVRYEDITAGTPISVPFPLYEAPDIQVIYGIAALAAVYNTDYTITLGDDFDTFTLTPTVSLIAKIDALIALDPDEENYITVRRRLDYLTDATAAAVRYTPFTSREFERTVLRFQQIQEQLNRALVLAPSFVGDQPLLRLTELVPGASLRVSGDGTALESGPLIPDIDAQFELAKAQADRAEREAGYAEEWAQSPNPISAQAGGNGVNDRSSKWWAQLSEQTALPDGLITFGKTDGTYGRITFNSVAGLKAGVLSTPNGNLELAYVPGAGKLVVVEGQEIWARGFRYEVAASGATDAHVETAGGVKLYVRKKNGCWYAEAFGVVTGDWLTDAPGDIVDCTAEFQAAINAMKSRETLKLPGGTIYIGDVTVPYGVLQVTFKGEGNFVPSTVIQFLPGATQGFRLAMEAYAFKSIGFRGLGNSAGAALFTSIRSDNYVDMDWSFEDCFFTETYHVGKLLGRGLTVDKCLYGTVHGDAWMLDYPNPPDVILAPPGYLGTLAGGFRGFVNRNCRFHGLFGYLFNVTGENAENARGFVIVGNQWDISPRVIKGSAQDAVFTGNACYCGSNTAVGTAFDMDLIRGLVISGNLISNSTTNRQQGDNPFVRANGSVYGVTIAGNTFISKDVLIFDANYPVGSPNAVQDLVIAGNNYQNCFVTAASMVRIKNTNNLARGIRIDETISGVPATWLAVDGDGFWREATIKVRMPSNQTIHNVPNNCTRDNEVRRGSYLGTGAALDITVGYPPKSVRIYKNDGTFAGVKLLSSLTSQPANIAFTSTGFSLTNSPAVNTSGTAYFWEAE